MSESDGTTPAPNPKSREDFVRTLRERAENAADASVHHASLSQRYLELSQKYSALAEQAGTTGLAELRQTAQALEGELPVSDSSESTYDDPFASRSNSETEQTSSPTPATPFASPFDDSHAVQKQKSVSAAPSRQRKRSPTTRRLVERFRSAKLAVARRVRIRARKADLQPKQRSAADELKKGSGSIATCVALFSVVVFLLSLITWQLDVEVPLQPIICAFASETKPVEEPQPVEPPEEEQGDQTEAKTEEPVEEPEPEPVEEMLDKPTPEEMPEPEMAEAAEPKPDPLPESTNATEATAKTEEAKTDSAVGNRSAAGKKALLQKYGGSEASESAVQLGLEWLLSVQHPQGYWDFIAVGPSGNPGTVNNPIGGTAYALLPFLAAGQTHKEGDYQKQVGAGLTYLSRVGVKVPAGYDLRGMINKQSDDDEPNEAYYVHGAATLVLCEAYGMTNDRRLKAVAEGAIQFLINSQDPVGGGWRYNPQEPGSTSVTAIQVMALMAAKKAGIKVPDAVLTGVSHYLDGVQVDREGRYGYEIEKKRYTGAVTSMALLCRMYLGWGRDDGDLRAGVALLDKAGPYENLYSLYFATQVMKNWGGQEWERWNTRLRDDLVAIQEQDGPAKGSWKPRTGAIHAKQGGRLLTTALATLTLEVYYRYESLLPEAEIAADSTP